METKNEPNQEDQSQDDKNLGGRPLKFQTVEELDLAIQNYFAECDPHTTKALVETGRDAQGNMLFDTRTVLTEQKPYTMSGLARAIGLSRQALTEYAERDGFGDSIRAAKQRCEEYAEQMLYSPFANGAKFNLTNNYDGWQDKRVNDLQSAGKPIKALVEFTGDDADDDEPADSTD